MLLGINADIEGGNKFFCVEVPSSSNSKKGIKRRMRTILDIINQRIDHKENIQSFVFAIAVSEGYIFSALLMVIQAYPEKLAISTKGNSATGNIFNFDVKEFIAARTKAELVLDEAKQRIRDASYATPESYFNYCKPVFGFDLDAAVRQRFIELKASRDIFVHNNGVENDIYMQKAGPLARCKKRRETSGRF